MKYKLKQEFSLIYKKEISKGKAFDDYQLDIDKVKMNNLLYDGELELAEEKLGVDLGDCRTDVLYFVEFPDEVHLKHHFEEVIDRPGVGGTVFYMEIPSPDKKYIAGIDPIK